MFAMEPDRLLAELDLTTQTIEAMEALLSTHKYRQASISSVLEAMTKPVSPLLATLKSVQAGKGFTYRGELIACRTCISLHCQALRKLWQEFPDRQELMAAAVANAGYNRCYVARDRDNLFQFKSRRWVLKFSREFFPGWYMDTNVTPERIKRILPLAVRAAGLEWGKDFAVNWY